jgi:hypothetical protein
MNGTDVHGGLPLRIVSALLLVALAGVITLILQVWVGGATLYDTQHDAQRSELHEFLFRNERPPGRTWTDVGANTANVRVLTVYLAEGIRRISGLPISSIYRRIETAGLFLSLVGLFIYLRRWFPPAFALIGLLYVAAVLPLTYFLHYFHPWDRLWLLAWIVCLLLLREGRIALFAVVLAVGVTIKFDILVLPALYFLVAVDRHNFKGVVARTLALFVVALGTFAALTLLAPGGFEPRSFGTQFARNMTALRELNIRYPPLLAFAMPAVLSVLGFRSADRFARMCAVFAALLAVPLFLASEFVEVRAELILLVLILPAALYGLWALLERQVAREQFDWSR